MQFGVETRDRVVPVSLDLIEREIGIMDQLLIWDGPVNVDRNPHRGRAAQGLVVPWNGLADRIDDLCCKLLKD